MAKSIYSTDKLDEKATIKGSLIVRQEGTDIYAISVDYDPTQKVSLQFFKTVQNKIHWVIIGQTAAEIIHQRADSQQANMRLTNWRGSDGGKAIRKTDVANAKNYLKQDDLEALNDKSK